MNVCILEKSPKILKNLKKSVSMDHQSSMIQKEEDSINLFNQKKKKISISSQYESQLPKRFFIKYFFLNNKK